MRLNFIMVERSAFQSHIGRWSVRENPDGIKTGDVVECFCCDELFARIQITNVIPAKADARAEWTHPNDSWITFEYTLIWMKP